MARAPQPERDPQGFEIYKLYVDLADRTSARRAGANTFFVSLHSIVASVVGYLTAVRNRPGTSYDHFSLVALAVVGVVLSLAWWGILRYYRRLNKAKFDVINAMEPELASQPFTDEWAILHPVSTKTGRFAWLKRQSHREATIVEQVVPLTFALVYLLLALRVALS